MPINILAISGSLRHASSNSALVEAVRRLAPASVEVSVYRGLADLPPFNPDLDSVPPFEAVAGLRSRLHACDGVLISSPEYAHGVPGVLKNALDWVVGSGEFVGKPVAVINASPRATHAWASLVETLTVMSAQVVDQASITVALAGPTVNADRLVADVTTSTALRSAVAALARAVGAGATTNARDMSIAR
jgi:chromate reductase